MARRQLLVLAERDDSVHVVCFLLAQLGAAVLSSLAYLGRLGLFLSQGVGLIFVPPFKMRRVMRQIQFLKCFPKILTDYCRGRKTKTSKESRLPTPENGEVGQNPPPCCVSTL